MEHFHWNFLHRWVGDSVFLHQPEEGRPIIGRSSKSTTTPSAIDGMASCGHADHDDTHPD